MPNPYHSFLMSCYILLFCVNIGVLAHGQTEIRSVQTTL